MGPTLRLERQLWDAGDRVVCGIDEVGRGAWAGPVTVAAVVPAPEHVEAPPVNAPDYFKAIEGYRGQLELAAGAHFVILD